MTSELFLEEQSRTDGVALTPGQAEVIRQLPGITVLPSSHGSGLCDINPGSMVGTLEIADLSLEITPKVPVRHLLFLIAYSADPKTWRDTYSHFEASDYWHESLIRSFYGLVQKVIVKGLMIGYRQQEDSLPTIRGRILFDEIVKTNAGTVFPIPVRFDELTEDIEVNRRIKSAVHTASSMRLRSAPNRRSIQTIFRELSQVQLTHYDRRNLTQIPSQSLSHDYRLALQLADLILRHCSIERGNDGVRAFSFLLDMNLLFQDFVTTALREALEVPVRSFPGREFGKRLFLDEQDEIKVKPDLSWWRGNQCSFIGDVKYKRSEENADYYQVLAYLTATDLKWGLLIYPNGEATKQSYTVRSEGRQIATELIDLDNDPDSILENIGEIADLIRGRREQTTSSVLPSSS